MRTALLSLAALSTLAPSHHADACGSYVPETRIYPLSTHHTRETGARTFVVLGGASDDARTWEALSPGTFDATRIAPGATLPRAMTFTLVGRDGTKVVRGSEQVFLAQTFAFPGAASAIEVPALGTYAFAIEGLHPDATWSELADQAASASQKRWVAARGATLDDIAVARERGVELLWAYDPAAHGYVTFVKRGDQEIARSAGRPRAIVELDGVRRAVIGDGAWTSSVRL